MSISPAPSSDARESACRKPRSSRPTSRSSSSRPGSVAGVASFYVLNHVPREHLAPLFERIRRWLAPGGLLLTTLGASDLPGWTGDWLGAPTYFSGFPPETNRSLLVDAGFELVRDELVTIREPEGEATFHWVLARR